jgi:hypothetical protein
MKITYIRIESYFFTASFLVFTKQIAPYNKRLEYWINLHDFIYIVKTYSLGADIGMVYFGYKLDVGRCERVVILTKEYT